MATGKRILIAEDEKSLSEALAIRLKSSGYKVKIVANGEKAIGALESGKFDLLLLDLIMPKMNGFEVLRKIKENNIPVSIIVASNLGQAEDEQKAISLGARDYFVKSNVSIADIILKIEETLK